jgi:hypothetical protein
VPPDSGDEGDDGNRISCAAVVGDRTRKYRLQPEAAVQLC